jgi:hypothetical protein
VIGRPVGCTLHLLSLCSTFWRSATPVTLIAQVRLLFDETRGTYMDLRLLNAFRRLLQTCRGHLHKVSNFNLSTYLTFPYLILAGFQPRPFSISLRIPRRSPFLGSLLSHYRHLELPLVTATLAAQLASDAHQAVAWASTAWTTSARFQQYAAAVTRCHGQTFASSPVRTVSPAPAAPSGRSSRSLACTQD